MSGTTEGFEGLGQLIAAIDRAVSCGEPSKVVDQLRRSMCRMIRNAEVQLPACIFEPHADRYARRELYTSEQLGYSVVAMTWGPGQGTPIHDHSGMWCVEGVWRGELEVTQYKVGERRGEHYHFEPVGSIQAGPGSAGSLIPPHEYHTIANPSDQEIAVSVHVYRAEMTECNVFTRLDERESWYERSPRRLGLDH